MTPPLVQSSPKPVPKWVWLIVAIVCAAVLILAVPIFIFGGDAIKERRNRIAFNSESWHQKKPEGIRLRMVDDLIKSNRLESKNRDQVVALLGETDGDPSVKTRFPGWHLYYHLGPSRETVLFRGLDYDYLVLRFDQAGKVIAIDIVTLKT